MKTLSMHFMEPADATDHDEWKEMKRHLREVGQHFRVSLRAEGIIRWDASQADMGCNKHPPWIGITAVATINQWYKEDKERPLPFQ